LPPPPPPLPPLLLLLLLMPTTGACGDIFVIGIIAGTTWDKPPGPELATHAADNGKNVTRRRN
jgi:hypothetical protein